MQLRQSIFEWDEQDDSRSLFCEMLHSGFLQTEDDAGDSTDKFEPLTLTKVVSEPSIDSAVVRKKTESKSRPTIINGVGGGLLDDSFTLGVWDVVSDVIGRESCFDVFPCCPNLTPSFFVAHRS
jgi:hypothetical protein